MIDRFSHFMYYLLMGKLTPSTEAQRIDQALQVWSIMTADPSTSQSKACEEVGIEPRTYRRWIAKAEPVLELYRETLHGVQRHELQHVIVAREAILNKIIDDGLDRLTAPEVRLQIYEFLVNHTDRLMDDVHVRDSGAADFMKGPKMHQAESKFSSHDTEIVISVKSPDIIDITPE